MSKVRRSASRKRPRSPSKPASVNAGFTAVARRAAFQGSRDFLQAIAEASADAIVTTDLHGRFTYFSPGAEAIFGYRAEEVLGQRIAGYYRNGMKEARAVMERLIAEGQIRHYETALRAKDGRWIDLDCSAALLKDANGTVIGTLGVGRDITERKRAEEALRDSEALTRGILESALDAVIAIDHERKIIEFNPAAERIFGYSRAQVLGRQMAELLVPPSLRERHQRGFVRYLTTGESVVLGRRLEFPALRADGTEFPAELTVTRLQGEGPPQFTAHLRDISERKRAEEALRESEERFRRAFDDAAVGMALQAMDGRYLRVNRAFCAMLGYPEDELLGRTGREVTHPDDLSLDAEHERRLLAGEVDWYQLEKRHLHKDGRSVVWTMVGVSAVRARNGSMMYRVVQVQDITQRKRAETRLREFAKRLAALRGIDRAIVAARSPSEIAQAALRHIRRLIPLRHLGVTVYDLDADEATIMAVEPKGIGRLPVGTRVRLESFGDVEALRRGEVVRVDDLLDLLRSSPVYQELIAVGIRSCLYVPLIVHGELIGSLNLGTSEPGAFDPLQVEIAREVADSLAVALHNARLFDQVREARDRLYAMARQLVEVQEAERRHLARELHDEIGQTLTALNLILQRRASTAGAEGARGLGDARELVDELLARVREMSLDLRPAMLDDFGLLPTLLWHFERSQTRTGVRVAFGHSGLERRFRPEVETAAYRIVQEALNNVARHAGASEAKVWVSADDTRLDIRIEDEGVGFDPDAVFTVGGTSGLPGARERAALLGGRLTIDSAPGAGTRLAATLPLRVEP
ncbi:MAG: PAS domain S-box protein [Candidatus Rokubacteria bacterium]|nr:PAS domain S-box protein [Candidatus Rokubacteria bacterium]